MKELKFICPSCGQRVQCDEIHAGENVPCPACATLIRVPRENPSAEVPTDADDASASPFVDEPRKVSYAPVEAHYFNEQDSPSEKATSPVESPASSVPPETKPLTQDVLHKQELLCTCPVCQSELRLVVEVHTSQTQPKHLSLEERERHISAARESHPISAYPPSRPRLEKILSDEARKAA